MWLSLEGSDQGAAPHTLSVRTPGGEGAPTCPHGPEPLMRDTRLSSLSHQHQHCPLEIAAEATSAPGPRGVSGTPTLF